MANSKPVADVFASLPGPRPNSKDRLVPLGAVWKVGENGGLSMTLASEPLAWRDPRHERRLVIFFRDKQGTPPAGAERGPEPERS